MYSHNSSVLYLDAAVITGSEPGSRLSYGVLLSVALGYRLSGCFHREVLPAYPRGPSTLETLWVTGSLANLSDLALTGRCQSSPLPMKPPLESPSFS